MIGYFFFFSNKFPESVLDASLFLKVEKELCGFLAMVMPFTFAPYSYAVGNVIINSL